MTDMNGWEPISTVPRNEIVLLGYFHNFTPFVNWREHIDVIVALGTVSSYYDQDKEREARTAKLGVDLRICVGKQRVSIYSDLDPTHWKPVDLPEIRLPERKEEVKNAS